MLARVRINRQLALMSFRLINHTSDVGCRGSRKHHMKCILSIDVEDWFHILDVPSTPTLLQWDFLPSRVEKNFMRLLDVLSLRNVRSTCFFLGWVAEKFPYLVREASRRGHEIASHGYSHELVYKMEPGQFYEDALHAKRVIEDIHGGPVAGYRASGFSVTKDTPWFFDKLIEAGYSYDSSIFPGVRGHGGLRTGIYSPYRIKTGSAFVEFPVSVQPVVGKPICFFGGGYLRLFPYSMIRAMAGRVLLQGRPVIFYIHPREIDQKAPRLPMSMLRRFKCYVNVSTTEAKIKKLAAEFELTTFQDFLNKSLLHVGADNDLTPVVTPFHQIREFQQENA